MPAGCDFICRNKECKYNGSGFTITAPWPMANINLVINSIELRDNQDFRDHLIKLKKEGKKLACIVYPNLGKIRPTHYRIQMWSEEAKCVWDFTIPYVKITEDELKKHPEIPSSCPKTGGDLSTFNDVIEHGILCPSCGERLEQGRWFAKEFIEQKENKQKEVKPSVEQSVQNNKELVHEEK